MRTRAERIIAVDFFTVGTVWLQRLSVLFFIEIGSRRVHVAGCTAHPDGKWVTQQARQVARTFVEREKPVRFLIRHRDCTFTSRSLLILNAQHDQGETSRPPWQACARIRARSVSEIALRTLRAR